MGLEVHRTENGSTNQGYEPETSGCDLEKTSDQVGAEEQLREEERKHSVPNLTSHIENKGVNDDFSATVPNSSKSRKGIRNFFRDNRYLVRLYLLTS